MIGSPENLWRRVCDTLEGLQAIRQAMLSGKTPDVIDNHLMVTMKALVDQLESIGTANFVNVETGLGTLYQGVVVQERHFYAGEQDDLNFDRL